MFIIGRSCATLHYVNDINIHQCPTCDILLRGDWNGYCALLYLTRDQSLVFQFALQPCSCIKMDRRYGMMAYVEDFPILNGKPNTFVTTFIPYFSDAPWSWYAFWLLIFIVTIDLGDFPWPENQGLSRRAPTEWRFLHGSLSLSLPLLVSLHA